MFRRKYNISDTLPAYKKNRIFAAGVKKCPQHVPLYQGWSSMEMRSGNYAVAKSLISEALTRDKTLGSGWLVAAQIEELQGNDGLVGLLLRRGIECCPNDAELYCALGEYQVKRGKYHDVSNDTLTLVVGSTRMLNTFFVSRLIGSSNIRERP